MTLVSSFATVQASAVSLGQDIAALSTSTPSTIASVVEKLSLDSTQLNAAVTALAVLIQQIATTYSGDPVIAGGNHQVDIGVP
jgi:hypothetical protein